MNRLSQKESNKPKVSILVPVYRAEKFIERCARSLFEQTYHNIEYIFADDCSPDDSIGVLKTIIAEYPDRANSVHILYHDHNRGVSAARNTIMDSCTGDFFFHVDPDDWIELDSIELLVNKQLETGADIVTANMISEEDSNQTEYLTGGYDMDRESALRAILDTTISHVLTRRLIRTSLVKDNNLRYVEGVNLDEDFQICAPVFYYAKSVSGVPNYIYHYDRTNESSYTHHITDWKILKQSLISYDIVKRFFFFFLHNLRDIIEKRTVKKYHESLFVMFEMSNREGFEYCKNYLLSCDKQYLKIIRWNNYIVRTLETNYYVMKAIMPIRMIRARIMQGTTRNRQI